MSIKPFFKKCKQIKRHNLQKPNKNLKAPVKPLKKVWEDTAQASRAHQPCASFTWPPCHGCFPPDLSSAVGDCLMKEKVLNADRTPWFENSDSLATWLISQVAHLSEPDLESLISFLHCGLKPHVQALSLPFLLQHILHFLNPFFYSQFPLKYLAFASSHL